MFWGRGKKVDLKGVHGRIWGLVWSKQNEIIKELIKIFFKDHIMHMTFKTYALNMF